MPHGRKRRHHFLTQQPPIPVLPLSLHPESLAPMAVNRPPRRKNVLQRLQRLQRQTVVTGDAELSRLLDELRVLLLPLWLRRSGSHRPAGRRDAG